MTMTDKGEHHICHYATYCPQCRVEELEAENEKLRDLGRRGSIVELRQLLKHLYAEQDDD